MDLKSFTSAIAQVAEEKGISAEKVLESIEMAIAAAYKKDYGKKGQIIKAKLDAKSGGVKFWQVKLVVNKDMIYSEEELAELKEQAEQKSKDSMSLEEEEEKGKIRFNPERHIMLDEAKKINPKIKAGEELEISLEPKKDYGRIAAQTAKQVILQRIREAEKESIFNEYKSKEGEIISGIVQRVEGRNVFLDIGKTIGILPREEQVPGEFYRPSQRLKTYLLKVEETPRGAGIILSRAYPKFISKLFELEVPEIPAGQVQIKSIAREPGSRSKVSVFTDTEGLDPIGSMLGQRGTRVMAVINELAGEKIDIIAYSEKPEEYIANALSPAKPLEIKILPKNKAEAIVADDQLSLAIGKDGQNVRLAAKLTGWKIDIKSASGEKVISAEKEEKEELAGKPEQGEDTGKKEKEGSKNKEKSKDKANNKDKKKKESKNKKKINNKK